MANISCLSISVMWFTLVKTENTLVKNTFAYLGSQFAEVHFKLLHEMVIC